ncbi:MAG: restriction endonuclease subunit S [Bacteroidales bacterium]|nr:restriction endonuclease subunit S [Bacteroidales bacterium]
MEYKRLGDYIRPVDVRNRELKVTNLLGLSIEKKFITSIANTIGTDMSVYKIVKPTQFAYVPVTSRNGDKITIALYKGVDDAIISQAYTVFEIKNQEKLLPEYLMMWFRRPEFDRYARFHSHGSAREVFDWDELCNVQLPIPSIDRQREIVSEYEALSSRIRLNEQMIANLEETAQALYRKMFVDGVDKENLPEGWHLKKFGTLVDVKRGASPRPIDQYMAKEGLPWLKISDATNAKSPYIIDVKECIKKEGLSSTVYRHAGDLVLSNSASPGLSKFLGIDSCIHDGWLYFDNSSLPLQFLYLTFLHIRKDLVAEGNGAVFINLNTEILKEWEIIQPDEKTMDFFCNSANVLFSLMKTIALEILKQNQLQSLLLARMGKEKL